MMDSIWLVLGLALLPALGNFSGGLAAEASRTTGRRLNYALHGAAGLVIAVVAVEIMPRVLESLSAWLIALAFALGGIVYVGLEKLVESRAQDTIEKIFGVKVASVNTINRVKGVAARRTASVFKFCCMPLRPLRATCLPMTSVPDRHLRRNRREGRRPRVIRLLADRCACIATAHHAMRIAITIPRGGGNLRSARHAGRRHTGRA